MQIAWFSFVGTLAVGVVANEQLFINDGQALHIFDQGPVLSASVESVNNIPTSGPLTEATAIALPSEAQITERPKVQVRDIDLVKRVTITANKNSSSASGDSSSVPALTSSTSDAMPTLSEQSSATSKKIAKPTVIVPSNSGNPFIQTSNLPEGTVFICVGAILGGLLAAVIIWRIAAGIALQRSIKAAEKAEILANGEDKTLLHNNQSIFALGSNASTLNMSTADLNSKADKRGKVKMRMSGIPSQGGLFFSPTADVLLNAQQAASGATSSMSSATLGGTNTMTTSSASVYNGSAGNMAAASPHNTRSSVYLPAGYYGSGGNGAVGSRISRNYSPASHRQSVPLSLANRLSTMESTNQQRPPSAYLDDLLAHSDSD